MTHWTTQGAVVDLPARFSIERLLGAGGFGKVFAARDLARGELVALKTLHELTPASLLNFKQEFRGLADLHHPNLVTLYELFSEGDFWCFTMELIHGQDFLNHVVAPREPHTPAPGLLEHTLSAQEAPTLRDDSFPLLTSIDASRERRFESMQRALVTPPPGTLHAPARPEDAAQHAARLDLPRLRDALRELFLGVSALHELGVLHRDIKPSNVLVTPQGRVVLLDFGLVAHVKQLHDPPTDSPHARQLQLLGTPHYMSPEQAMGLPLDTSSDWYSVGIMLYEALTGRRPIEGSSPVQIMLKKQSFEPVPVLQLAHSAPPDLAALCMALIARDPDARPDAEAIARALKVPPAARMRRALTSPHQRPFVGRLATLQILRDAYDALLRHQQPALLSICGPSGIGKTALARRFITEVAQEGAALIIEGRCFESESVPFKAVDHLIDQLGHHLDALTPAQRELLVRPEIAPLCTLFPILEPRLLQGLDDSEVLRHGDPSALRRRAFEALRQLLRALGAIKPLVLFIDDVHWGDEDSAMLLEHLVRPPDAPPLILLISWRTEDASQRPFLTTFEAAQQRWEAPIARQQIELKELDHEESEALARALLAHDQNASAHVERITREARGNPLFIDELARFARDIGRPGSGMMSLEDVLHQRIALLDEPARRLLQIVSLCGQPMERSLARQLAALQDGEQAALVQLRSELFLRSHSAERGDLLETYHARVREAVLARLPPDQRVRDHLAMAEALSQHPGVEPDHIAQHFLGAQLPQRAVPFLLQASERSAEVLAIERAARQLAMALSHAQLEPDRTAALYERLGALYGALGRGQQAAQAFRDAIRWAPPEAHPQLERRAADQLLRAGYFDQGSQTLIALMRQAGLNAPRNRVRAVVEILAQRARLTLQGLEPLRRVALNGARKERADLLWSASRMISIMDLEYGAYFTGLHLFDALEHGDPDHLCIAITLESVHQSSSTRGRSRAPLLLARAEALLPETRERPYCEGFIAYGHAMHAYLEGRWRASLDHFRRAEHLLETECQGVVWELDGARFYQLFSLDRLGRFDWFVDRLPHYLSEAEERQDLLYATNWRIWSHITHLVRDEPERAEREVQRAMDLWPVKSYLFQSLWSTMARGRIALHRGDAARAVAVMQDGYGAARRSFLLRNESIAAFYHDLWGRTLLALIIHEQRQPGRDRAQLKRLRSALDRRISDLSKNTLPFASHAARLLRAQLEWLDGELRSALHAFSKLEREALQLDMIPLHHALRALGARATKSAPHSAAQLADALASLQAQRVVNPARFMRVYVPLLAILD